MNVTGSVRATLACLVCLAAVAAHARHLSSWEFVDLGVLRPGGQSFGMSLNDRGDVTGYASVETSITMHAFLWQNGVMRDLGVPVGSNGVIAHDIDFSGRVVGGTMESQAVAWEDGRWRSLGFNGEARAINHAGDIVGTTVVGPHERAVMLRDGVLTDLGTLGGLAARVNNVNDWGHVVGSSSVADGSAHAFLWAFGDMRDVGPADRRSSVATAINNHNVVVGFASDGGSEHVTAFLWYGHTFRLLPGMEGVFPTAINERSDIVGTLAGERGAFLLADGELVRLDRVPTVRAAGLTDVQVTGINNRRWIVGYGTNRSGAQRAFLLIPDPVFP